MLSKTLRLYCCAIILVMSAQTRADDVNFNLFNFLMPAPTKQEIAGNAFAQYQRDATGANLNALARLGNNFYAQNYLGCIYYNGIHVKPNPELAAKYFLAVSNAFPLAAHNYGVYLQSIRNHALAERYFYTAYINGGYEQSGTQLLAYYLKGGKDVTSLLSELEPLDSPNALLVISRAAAARGDYIQALNKSSKAAGANYPEAFSWNAQMYFDGYFGYTQAQLATAWYWHDVAWALNLGYSKMPSVEQVSADISLSSAWSVVPESNQADAKYTGYVQARTFFERQAQIIPRYSVAVCESDNRINPKRRFQESH